MAGIGFQLRKLFKEDYYSARIKAYTFAGFVTTGPWIIIILTITLTQLMLLNIHVDLKIKELFTISISYCFIFSYVLFSPQQLIVTRYLSDLIYFEKEDDIFPTLLGMAKFNIVFVFIIWCVYAVLSPLPLLFNISILVLFLVIINLWIFSLFLSAVKAYNMIGYAFLTGAAVTGVAFYLVTTFVNLSSMNIYLATYLLLSLFTLGLIITLLLLSYVLITTFQIQKTKGQFNYFHYYDQHPKLFFIGLFYGLGVWIINWIIWFGEGAVQLEHAFIYNPIYDNAVFWGYLTVIPTLISFVVIVETRFYTVYKTFYNLVNGNGSLSQIKEAKKRMQLVLKQELERLFRNQLIITIVIVSFSGYFFEQFHMGDDFIGIFRFTAIGAFANISFLIVILLLLYFEDQTGALRGTIYFLGMNCLSTAVLLPLGFEGYGLSYCIGSVVALIYSLTRLISYVDDIDYHTFCHQVPTKSGNRFKKIGNFLERHSY